MVLKVVSIRTAPPYKLVITFSDGAYGTFNASGMIGQRGEGAELLRERRYFGQVELANGVPTWPNHFDLSPEWLREEMLGRGELVVPRASRQR
jgi:hypothetical protein